MTRALIALAVCWAVSGCVAAEPAYDASGAAGAQTSGTASGGDSVAETTADALAGEWIPVTLHGHAIAAFPAKRVEMRFNRDGSVGARNGCNLYLGTFVVDGAKLAVNWESISREVCVKRDASGALVSDMLDVPNPDVLSKARSFQVADETLELVDSDGLVLGAYRRR